MTNLGETNDPRELVPGDAGAVTATARALRTRGDALHQAGAGLQRIDTTDGWSGYTKTLTCRRHALHARLPAGRA
jgi:hypothetical protein